MQLQDCKVLTNGWAISAPEAALAKICGCRRSIINQSINQAVVRTPELDSLSVFTVLNCLTGWPCVLTSHVSRMLFNYCARVCWLTNIALTANELSAFVCPLSPDRSRRSSSSSRSRRSSSSESKREEKRTKRGDRRRSNSADISLMSC